MAHHCTYYSDILSVSFQHTGANKAFINYQLYKGKRNETVHSSEQSMYFRGQLTKQKNGHLFLPLAAAVVVCQINIITGSHYTKYFSKTYDFPGVPITLQKYKLIE